MGWGWPAVYDAVGSAVDASCSCIASTLLGVGVQYNDAASVPLPGAGTLQWDKLKKSGNFPHLARWWVAAQHSTAWHSMA